MEIEAIIKEALKEDIGRGDITTDAALRCVGKPDVSVKALIIAREGGILCGIDIIGTLFLSLDPDIQFRTLKDGTELIQGQKIAEIDGSARAILCGERTALNFLCHLSGIATRTRQFVHEIEGTGVQLLDTRKTTPLLREMEKYAVKVGGGENHRFGLFDAILVKDNHLKILGGLENLNLDRPYEVEVKTMSEFKKALNLKNVKTIMLDNMKIEDIKKAVKIRDRLPITDNRSPKLEVSGGVTLENVRKIAETGVEYISVGAITHSAYALDMSLEII
ncbi:carboxylating nicotinate-nucleotide diphosphorylase [candidate division WOR-3 bacterium]|nr:carboxylating nicotinate-nucleotide diphosphorylase [candidate division WOR-3 bacterium]